MTLLFALLIFFLAALNNSLVSGGANYFPTLLCLVWGGALALLGLMETSFYQPPLEALLLFAGGAIAFSVGGWLGHMDRNSLPAVRRRRQHQPDSAWTRQTIDVSLWAILAILPLAFSFYLRSVTSLIDRFSNLGIFWDLRTSSLLTTIESGGTIDLVENLPILALILPLICLTFPEKSKAKKLQITVALIVALTFAFATSASSGFLRVLITCAGIILLRKTHSGWMPILAVGGGGVIFFLAVAWLVGKGGAETELGFFVTLPTTLRVFILYLVGPLAAFGQIASDPDQIGNPWNPWNFFLLTFNKLGASFLVPSKHAPYVSVSPTELQNVYSFYFGYVATFGVPGTIFVLTGLGFVGSRIRQRAQEGGPYATLLYGFFFSAVTLSFFNDQFFLGLDLVFKTLAVCWAIHGVGPWLRRFFAGRRHRSKPQYSSGSKLQTTNNTPAQNSGRPRGITH